MNSSSYIKYCSRFERDTQMALFEFNSAIEKLEKKLPKLIVTRALTNHTFIRFQEEIGDWDQLGLIWRDIVDLHNELQFEVLRSLPTGMDIADIEEQYEERYG